MASKTTEAAGQGGSGSDVFHAQGAYLFQDTCINLSSPQNIAGDYVNVQSGGWTGPSGFQLDRISGGLCGPLYSLQKALKPRTITTASGAQAKWDGRVMDM